MSRPPKRRTVICPCGHAKTHHRARTGCRALAAYDLGMVPGHDWDGNEVLVPDEVRAPCQCGRTPDMVQAVAEGRPLDTFQPMRRRRGVPA